MKIQATKCRKSNALCSAGPSILKRDKGMQNPSEVQKPINKAKVRFLPAEEAINIRPGTTATRQIARANLGTPSERTNVVAKNATSECHPLTEKTIFGSTAKRPKTIIAQEDRPGKPVAPAVIAKPNPCNFESPFCRYKTEKLW